MSQLTQEHFDEVITGFKAHVDERFEHMDQRFDKVDTRLDRIETLLWHGQRLEELERRVIRLAELAGDASLATPFRPPVPTE